jgi:glycine hydroxymethyltransferase
MSIESIKKFILEEKNREIFSLELIASENFVSEDILDCCGSILTNKYAEGYPGKRYYGGCEFVDKIESLAIENLKKLFGASWANVQPHSGSSANMAAICSLLDPFDTILGLDLCHGGHLSHGFHLSFSGKFYKANFYGVSENGFLDYENLEKIAKKEKPKLIICGASAYSRDWDYKKIREIANEINAYVLADIAHPAGLIAKKLLNDPLDFCHVITSTTHKTLRGPRGGIIFGKEDFEIKGKKISQLVNSSVFPLIQGGPLMHTIAAKAVCFQEALSEKFYQYSKKTIDNSKELSESFKDLGYKIITEGTDNHLFLIDLSNKNISGKEAQEILEKANITLNKNMIPFDKKSAAITSGIRIGTPAITTRGLVKEDMKKIAILIDEVLSKKDEKTILKVKKEVNEWMESRPLFNF